MNQGFVYLSAAKASVLQQLVYVGELLLRNINLIIFMMIFVALWSTAYSGSGQPELAGYRLEEVIWYLAMTESILLARSGLWQRISQEVKSGDIAYKLTRPYIYPVFEISTSLGDSIVRLSMNILVAGIVAFVFTKQIVGTPMGWLLFGVMALVGLIIDAIISVVIGLISFFMEEVQPVFWIYDKLLFTLGGLFMPLEIFPNIAQTVAEWLPLKAILYLPSRIFVKFTPALAQESLIQQVLTLGTVTIIVSLLWPICTRRVTIHGG